MQHIWLSSGQQSSNTYQYEPLCGWGYVKFNLKISMLLKNYWWSGDLVYYIISSERASIVQYTLVNSSIFSYIINSYSGLSTGTQLIHTQYVHEYIWDFNNYDFLLVRGFKSVYAQQNLCIQEMILLDYSLFLRFA